MVTAIVSISPERDVELESLLEKHIVAHSHFGEVVPDNMTIFPELTEMEINLPVSDLRAAYEGAIPAAMEQVEDQSAESKQ